MMSKKKFVKASHPSNKRQMNAFDEDEDSGKLRILVTGNGYIAEHTIKRLLNEGYDVRYTYRGDGGPPLREEVLGVCMNLCDVESCSTALWQSLPDVIIHTAAISSPAACEKDPELAMETNCPIGFLEACFAVVPDALFIQLSTDIVFEGRDDTSKYYKDGGFDKESACAAIDKARPINIYGKSKLAFEKCLIESWPRLIILRLSNVLGPESPYTKSGKFTQWFINTLRTQGSVSLWYDEIRSFLHIDQFLSGICALIQKFAIMHQPCRSQARLDDLTAATKPSETIYYEREIIRSTYPPICIHLNFGGPQPLSRFDVGKIIAARLGLTQEDALIPTSRSSITLSYPSPLDVAMDSANFQHILRVPLLNIEDAPSGFAALVAAPTNTDTNNDGN